MLRVSFSGKKLLKSGTRCWAATAPTLSHPAEQVSDLKASLRQFGRVEALLLGARQATRQHAVNMNPPHGKARKTRKAQ